MLATAAREAAGNPQRPGRRCGLQRRRRGPARRPDRARRCATTTPASWATPTSKTGCCATSTRSGSAPSARTPWKGWPRKQAEPGNADRAARARRRSGASSRKPSPASSAEAGFVGACPQGRAGAAAHLRSGAHADRPRACTSGTRIGGCRRCWRSYPRLSTDRDAPTRATWNGSRPAIRCSRRSRRHALRRPSRTGRPARASTRSTTMSPARIDFYRARVVDGLGHVIHERLFAVEIGARRRGCACASRRSWATLTPADRPMSCPPMASSARGDGLAARAWRLQPFLDEVREERLTEVDRIADHVEISLTELTRQGGRGDRPRAARIRSRDRRRRGPAGPGREPARGVAGPARPRREELPPAGA